MPDPLMVYYDGQCPLCRREIAFYRRRRGAQAISWIDVAAWNRDPAPDLCRRRALARFHVRTPNGQLVAGAAAFAALWRALPGFRALGRLCALPGVVPALDLAYGLFLRVRPWLRGRRDPPAAPGISERKR